MKVIPVEKWNVRGFEQYLTRIGNLALDDNADLFETPTDIMRRLNGEDLEPRAFADSISNFDVLYDRHRYTGDWGTEEVQQTIDNLASIDLDTPQGFMRMLNEEDFELRASTDLNSSFDELIGRQRYTRDCGIELVQRTFYNFNLVDMDDVHDLVETPSAIMRFVNSSLENVFNILKWLFKRVSRFAVESNKII